MEIRVNKILVIRYPVGLYKSQLFRQPLTQNIMLILVNGLVSLQPMPLVTSKFYCLIELIQKLFYRSRPGAILGVACLIKTISKQAFLHLETVLIIDVSVYQYPTFMCFGNFAFGEN